MSNYPYRMEVPNQENYIFETDAVKIAKQYSQLKFKTMLDIGAHAGYFSLYVAEQADIVYAIEPVMDNYWCLVKNIINNSLSNKVFPMLCAMRHEEGDVEIHHLQGGNSGQHLMSRVNSDRSVRIKAISLPNLLRLVGQVDYLKCDIEGTEYNIFPPTQEIASILCNVKILELSTHSPWRSDVFTEETFREFSAYRNLETAEQELIGFLTDVGFRFIVDRSNGDIYHGYNANYIYTGENTNFTNLTKEVIV